MFTLLNAVKSLLYQENMKKLTIIIFTIYTVFIEGCSKEIVVESPQFNAEPFFMQFFMGIIKRFFNTCMTRSIFRL